MQSIPYCVIRLDFSKFFVLIVQVLLFFLYLAVAPPETLIATPEEPRSNFSIVIGKIVYNWSEFSRFVMPGESLLIRIFPQKTDQFNWVADAGEIVSVDSLSKIWVAPVPTPETSNQIRGGLYHLTITDESLQTKVINLFVLVPFSVPNSQKQVPKQGKKGWINNYRLGLYPKKSPHPKLQKPSGFIEVTEENFSTKLSPNYELKEFVTHDKQSFPKYISLKEELILKLELLTKKIRDKGYSCSKLKIHSGFRSPIYNAGGGGGRNSAHIYGGAADVFVDEDNDTRIDDLNSDGKYNSKDTKVLCDIVDEFDKEFPGLVGGLGWYRRVRKTEPFGPFIHIDIRGKPSRWRK